MSRPDGGPAFPLNQIRSASGEWHEVSPGMSLRDYFAAKAMQGHMPPYSIIRGEVNDAAIRLAASAYAIADAMLAERGKP